MCRNVIAVWRHARVRTALRFSLALVQSLRAIVRTRSVGAADRRMSGVTAEFRVGKDVLRLPGSYFGGGREIYCLKTYTRLPQMRIRNGDFVVDLGANIGVFTTLAAKLGARVLAVEAQPGFKPIFEDLLALNHCEDAATLVVGLVGESRGLYSDKAVLDAEVGVADSPSSLDLTTLLDRHVPGRVDFLKIDIEGSEFGLLSPAGAPQLWLDRTQRVAMEIHQDYGDATEIVKTLVTAGFEVLVTDQYGKTLNVPEDISGLLSLYAYAWRA